MAQSTDDGGEGVDSMHDRYTVVHTIRVDENDIENDTESQNNKQNNDAESQKQYSVSLHNLSTTTESSGDSRTCDSFGTDDRSDALEREDFFDDDDEYEDLESLGSNPIVDGWVDSACSCLDHPISLFQGLGFGKETSLLRQSKGRTRSTITSQTNATSSVANMKDSAAERRNLRLQRKGIHGNGETSDIESTMGILSLDDAKNKEIRIMHIQPKEKFECKNIEPDSSGEEDKYNKPKEVGEEPAATYAEKHDDTSTIISRDPMQEVGKEPVATYAEESDDTNTVISRDSIASNLARPDETQDGEDATETDDKTNEELEEAGDSIADSFKFVEERTMEDSSKQDEEDQSQLSNTSNNAKIDPPIEPKIASTVESQKTDSILSSNDLKRPESSDSEIPSENLSQVGVKKLKDNSEDVQSLSNRGEHSTVDKKIIMESEARHSDSVSQGNEAGITDLTHVDTDSPSANDESSRPFSDGIKQMDKDISALSNNIEIIDVLSMDDQDSWTPGSRNDHKQSISKKLRIKDNSSPLSVQGSTSSHKRDVPLSSSGDQVSDNVDDLWFEEEEKLNKRFTFDSEASSRPKIPSNAETAEDLWNEERFKLQTTSDDIFDDPKAREAFLGHRRGKLQDAGMDSSKKSSRSQARRKLQNILRGDIGDSDGSKGSSRLLRSRSLGVRNPPSSENGDLIKQSRSKSRERRLANRPIPPQKDTEHSNISSIPPSRVNERLTSRHTPSQKSVPSRVKDLIVVRSIEEGQRIRSSKRESIKYGAGSHQNDPINVNKYGEEAPISGPYDEGSSSSLHRRISDLQTKSSKRRSKSRDPKSSRIAKTIESENDIHTNDERDDHESIETIRPSKASPVDSNERSDYENAISATKELRKLEKKIERQLRQAKRGTKIQDSWDSQIVPSKEIRRMEKKLAMKLKAVKSNDLDSQTVSSMEIRRLEKQLAQKLSGDTENRASKLKRIKRKVSKSSSSVSRASSSALPKEQRQIYQVSSSTTHLEHDEARIGEASPEFLLTSTSFPGKARSPKNQGTRDEGPNSGNIIGRQQYVRRGGTNNNLSPWSASRRVPVND